MSWPDVAGARSSCPGIARVRLELLVAPSWWSVRPCSVVVLRHIFARVEL